MSPAPAAIIHALRSVSRRFSRDSRGSIAIIFALALIPLLFAVGAGLDYGRSVNFKAQLQGATDAAALAGAGAYVSATSATSAASVAQTYMANFAASMPSSNITYKVSLGTQTSGLSVTVYKVTVSASGTINNTIMALTHATNQVDVTSTAKNPVYSITLKLSTYSSDAGDANTIYFYIVPADNSIPATTALTPFFSNNSSIGSPTITIQLTASQKLGFMLQNVTDGRRVGSNFGSNGYGGTYLSVHNFYSHLMPPSLIAYPKVTQNCSLQVTATASAIVTGCLSTLPANAAVNCASASGKTLVYSWNDMGGPSDDKDFNDLVYTVQCNQVDTSQGSGVVLTN